MATETLTAEVAADVTPEVFMRLRRPLTVVASPDGQHVAYSVTKTFAERGERPRSEIWTAEPDGDAVQATRGPGTDSLPRWSPDGTLAFASDRDHPGRLALYLLGPGPGEARPLGDIPGSVEDLRWSPDGSELLVLAADVGADRAGIQAATRIEEVGAGERDPKVTRPFQAWRRLYRVDAATGEAVEIGPPGVNVWELDWPGGRHAAVVASDEPSESAWYGAYVALVDLEQRSAERLYSPAWQIAVPRFSGDGKHVCFVEGFCSDRGVLAGTVTALELESRTTRVLAPDLDVAWLQRRDDRSFWYAGWRGMGSMCGWLSLDGSRYELWAGDATIGPRFQPQISASADGNLIATVKESPEDAPEVVAMNANAPDDGWRALSALNVDVAGEIPSVRCEARTWRSGDFEIEGLLLRPPDAGDEPLPLVVLVHGGPTGLWSYSYVFGGWISNMLASRGYAVLLPNPRGSAGRGQEFARANLGDMGGGDLEDILAGVDDCIAAGIADGDRVGIIGGSYGGFMAAWAVTQTDRFRASIPISCVSDWLSFHLTTNIGRFDELFLDADPYDPGGEYATRSPVVHARRCRTPTLVMHGEEDLCTPIGQAQELYQALVEAGVETELVVYPREGHGWLEREHQLDAWERISGWFDRHLLGRDAGS